MTPTRTFSALIVTAVITACGGGDRSSPSATGSGADSSSIDGVIDGVIDGGTATTAATDPATSTTGEPSATTTQVYEITDAEPWRVQLSEPVGPRLDGWIAQAAHVPTPTGSPAGLTAQLAWIYQDLIELWRGDLRLVALGMNRTALDSAQRETSPEAVIDLIGAAGSMLRDSYEVIVAFSEVASASEGPDAQLFDAWSEYAGRWVDAAELVRLAMVGALDLEPADQACFLAVIDGEDDCGGPGAESAFELMIELEDRFSALDATEIADLRTYAAGGLEFDECAAWDAAVAAVGVSGDEELRMWIAVDDDELDEYFVSFSACAPDLDPEGDGAADLVAFGAYLTAIADAIVESGYDETIDEMGDGAEDERRYREATSSFATEGLLTAARNSASLLWPDVYDPGLATKLYVVRGIVIDDWVDLARVELSWDDLDVPVCEVWTDVVESYPAGQRIAIDAAVDHLGLTGSLIPEACG